MIGETYRLHSQVRSHTHTRSPGSSTSQSTRQSTRKTSNTTPYMTKENAQEYTRTSTMLVGPKHTPFHLHTHLLTQHSAYFRAALLGPFIESSTSSITLSDISPSHLSLLVTHLHTTHIPHPLQRRKKPAYYTLLHTYALADRLGLEAARNAISTLADTTNSVPTPSAYLGPLLIFFVFKKTDRLVEGHP
ncbi:hypothetical protein COCCADRAFT_31672 [Bipolaris zeicola 26-R-13]|uniref:BTB domain-containing protein n=1 Tax=Cochliobolus carbonum (strain 26-R-13) TaxID=930089 RepID=W6YUY5_COCC2|nr:uncharacterized protein COCCADRAFT_31672 [Bipolaris zeicola 26-R-13]EUC39294.1 hypothetical protein COCCADRAFT_31672 [Bipolaris zeicola 26-R-13]